MTVSSARLETHVRALAEDYVPRDFAHVGNLERVAEYVSKCLSESCEIVREQPFMVDGTTYRNVSALFGTDGGPRIVIGAHYDAAGPYPAADDNASGVAGLIELARLLAERPFVGTVELVAYTLEEPPFFFTKKMGSYVHAASLKKQRVDLRAMLSLEMIGYFSDDPGSQNFPFFLFRPFYPSEGNFIAVVGRLFQRRLVRTIRDAMRAATPLPVHSLNAAAIVPGVALSDHLNYWRHKYPAAMITDTAMFRNPNYHRPSDTADTLDYERMAMVVEGVFAAVNALLLPHFKDAAKER